MYGEIDVQCVVFGVFVGKFVEVDVLVFGFDEGKGDEVVFFFLVGDVGMEVFELQNEVCFCFEDGYEFVEVWCFFVVFDVDQFEGVDD